jgi:hypothetical protein
MSSTRTFLFGQGTTDSTGAFTVSDILPGSYTVQFGLPGGLNQYAHQKLTFNSAGSIVVTAAATTQLERRSSRTAASPAPDLQRQYGTQAEVTADGNGRYTFANLGPYDWPIFYKIAGYASEWSGHTGNRLQANQITVKAGKTKTHDERLSHGVTRTGLVTTATGQPIDLFRARISVSESRDEIGVGDTDADGRYTVQVLPGSPSCSTLTVRPVGLGSRSTTRTRPTSSTRPESRSRILTR